MVGDKWQFHDMQPIEGWITMTWLDTEGQWAIYGPFESEDKAAVWQAQLLPGTVVRPLYTPFVYSRG